MKLAPEVGLEPSASMHIKTITNHLCLLAETHFYTLMKSPSKTPKLCHILPHSATFPTRIDPNRLPMIPHPIRLLISLLMLSSPLAAAPWIHWWSLCLLPVSVVGLAFTAFWLDDWSGRA